MWRGAGEPTTPRAAGCACAAASPRSTPLSSAASRADVIWRRDRRARRLVAGDGHGNHGKLRRRRVAAPMSRAARSCLPTARCWRGTRRPAALVRLPRRRFDPLRARGAGGGATCRRRASPMSDNDRCPFAPWPELLGRAVQALAVSGSLFDDFPYACAGGTFDSTSWRTREGAVGAELLGPPPRRGSSALARRARCEASAYCEEGARDGDARGEDLRESRCPRPRTPTSARRRAVGASV